MARRQSLWDRIWKDNNGNVVLWQTPNKAIWAWAACTVLSLFFSGKVADIFGGIASIALIIWALLEIFCGVNYFRRALGLLILVFATMTAIKSVSG